MALTITTAVTPSNAMDATFNDSIFVDGTPRPFSSPPAAVAIEARIVVAAISNANPNICTPHLLHWPTLSLQHHVYWHLVVVQE